MIDYACVWIAVDPLGPQAVATFKLQRWVVERFYMKCVVSFSCTGILTSVLRVTAPHESWAFTIMKRPYGRIYPSICVHVRLCTCMKLVQDAYVTPVATFFFVATQVSGIITYFVSHGLRVARERAYNQTIESRNKGLDFWRPYVEEWDNPPKVSKDVGFSHLLGGTVGRIAVRSE